MRTPFHLALAFIASLPACSPPGKAPARSAPAPTVSAPWDLEENFAPFQAAHWSLSNGYANGPSFNCGWRADRARFDSGRMTLRIDAEPCPTGCSGRPYAGAELSSRRPYGYGRLEGSLKVAKGIGMVTALFFYDHASQDEIDIEILGKDPTRLQTNFYTGGVGQHESLVDLGFDASTEFHTYAIDWSAQAIRWYVDDRLVHEETGDRGPLPSHPASILANLWPGHGTGTEAWLGGALEASSLPAQAQYAFIRYRAAR